MTNIAEKGDAVNITQKSLMRTLIARAQKGEGPLPDFEENHACELEFADITATKINAEIKEGGRALLAESYSFVRQGSTHCCPFTGLTLSDSRFFIHEKPAKLKKKVSKRFKTMYGIAIVEESDDEDADKNAQADQVIRFVATQHTVVENAHIIDLQVERMGNLWNDVAVSFMTKDGTACAGINYEAAEGKLEFKK